ncbi:hypothetical protein GCM10011321_25010 [Youhaiella tibetensis]|uniref:PepSY domain-containing protein n=1 Tax=Paradevosia tibetensis TaxID=1447062 RepID=A0A5B9DK89_9HYPH|nr:PepSY domain-containing protein [Youhaiella tibetensis]AKR54289.1 hypothetical protein XM25_00405 [Devosia sp. H5989]QEE19476.1 PepSY domain-containing protein [Youhaiella tibetensis]GGF32762.1 hypothetical protein GCM10011321_25010 [Youhaiella tibetensis]
MQKLLLPVLLAVSSVGAMALPAQAASVPRCEIGSSTDHFDADENELRVRGLGLNVQRVEEWNNCIRAYVRNADGSESVMYFDPVSLRQVGGDYQGF